MDVTEVCARVLPGLVRVVTWLALAMVTDLVLIGDWWALGVVCAV